MQRILMFYMFYMDNQKRFYNWFIEMAEGCIPVKEKQ